MAELKDVVEYLKGKPAVLQADNLIRQDRTMCFIMHNKLVYAINLENPSYKTMKDLMQESVISVKEMRDDVERMISRRYSEVPLIDGLKFIDVITELGRVELDNHQNCISYLTDLAISSLVVLESNQDIEAEVKLVLDTLIYICVIALNLFNKATETPLLVEGVEISFGRKRKATAV